MAAIAKHVKLLVGGLRYTLAASDLKKHPESIFNSILNKEWKTSKGDEPIKIERDGDIFRYVNAFLVSGNLPRKPDGSISLNSDMLNAIKEEAKFYNLPKLLKECNRTDGVFEQVASYDTIRSYIWTIKDLKYEHHIRVSLPTLLCKYASSDPIDIVNLLASARTPICITGSVYKWGRIDNPLFMSSTVTNLNVVELLAHAKQSAVAIGTDAAHGSFEIAAEHLNAETLARISSSTWFSGFHAMSYTQLKLRPNKLVIYQGGGHFDQHRDTVRGDNHIGMMEVVLNSDYTGGELEVTHGGRTEEVTGPYTWVAMYRDCLHKINPVTSGTRVSLIYDICSVPENAPVTACEVGASHRSDFELAHFLDVQRRERLRTDGRQYYIRGIDLPQQQLICAALDRELDTYGTVVICLAHLYPACQSNPSFLKGGDLALYELLRDKYQVSVETVSVYTSHDYEHPKDATLCAAMLRDVALASEADAAQGNKQAVETFTQPAKQALFVIPVIIGGDCVVDYSPYVESYSYNGCQSEEETVYIVSGLQVRKL